MLPGVEQQEQTIYEITGSWVRERRGQNHKYRKVVVKCIEG